MPCRAVDKGYFSGREILACHAEGITTTVPRPETSGNRVKGMYVKADFAYDAAADVYRCPAGKTLTYRCTTEERGLQLRRYWTSDCKACPIKARCTTGKERRITRWEHEHPIDDMRDRMSRDPGVMALTVSSPWRPRSTCTFATHNPRGNAAAMKTQTGFYASISRKALIYRALAKPNSARWHANSTSGPERPCNTRRQPRNLKPVLQRSVETTPRLPPLMLRRERAVNLSSLVDFATKRERLINYFCALRRPAVMMCVYGITYPHGFLPLIHIMAPDQQIC